MTLEEFQMFSYVWVSINIFSGVRSNTMCYMCSLGKFVNGRVLFHLQLTFGNT